MKELPTDREFFDLWCKTNSGDALIWCAWRSVLRAFPLIATDTFENSWGNESVYNIYNSSQHILTYCRYKYNESDKKIARDTSNKTINLLNKSIFHLNNIGINLYYQNLSYDFETCDSALLDASKNTVLAIKLSSTLIKNIEESLIDINYIKRGFIPNESNWNAYPLWKNEEPIEFYKLRKKLSIELNKIGLDFISEDINLLTKNHYLGDHSKNYLNNVSESVLNNPEALRRIILHSEGEYIHSVRTILVGPGGSGKTSLANRIVGKPNTLNSEATRGIECLSSDVISLKKEFPRFNSLQRNIDIHIWDFGGQAILQGLHSAFLHENCVYILVVDSRHEQEPDTWLQQIKHLAGKEAKVLVVTNIYNKCLIKQNETRLLRKFPEIIEKDSFFYFSCLYGDSNKITEFIKKLADYCLLSQRMVLDEINSIKNEILNFHKEIIIRQASLENILLKKIDKEEVNYVILNLESIGYIIPINEEKYEYCIMPSHLIKHIYNIVYSPTLKKKNGLISLAEINDIMSESSISCDTRGLIRFLIHKNICIKVNSHLSGYFFPFATSSCEPNIVSKIISGCKLTLEIDIPYFPFGMHSCLVANFFDKASLAIKSLSDVWKKGFIFHYHESVGVLEYINTNKIIISVTDPKSNYRDIIYIIFNEILNVYPKLIKPNIKINYHPDKNRSIFSIKDIDVLYGIINKCNNHEISIAKEQEMKNNINIGNHSQVVINSKNFTQKNSNDPRDLSSRQKEIMLEIVKEIIASSNPAEEVLSLSRINSYLDNSNMDSCVTESEKRILSKVWKGLNEITSFTNNSIGVVSFIESHQENLTALINKIMHSLS